jgi:type IV fimbrial biogenesis protein FimT
MLKNQKAFTLIELMVTLAVLAVIIGFALPSFTQQIVNSTSATLGNDLVTAINFTRQEAVKRGKLVSICPSTDGMACLTSADWAKGWLVFEDGAASVGLDPVVRTPLRQWSDLNGKTVMTVTGAAALAYVRFTGVGMLARTSSADVSPRVFVVSVTGCAGMAKNTVTVGLAGMNNLTKTACP